MGERVGDNCPPYFYKLREGGGLNSFAPLFGIRFKKKNFFTLVWKHIYCPFSQGYKVIWIRVCFETIVTFFLLLHSLFGRLNNNKKKRSKNNKSPKLCLGDLIIIIRNGAKTISLPNFVWET